MYWILPVTYSVAHRSKTLPKGRADPHLSAEIGFECGPALDHDLISSETPLVCAIYPHSVFQQSLPAVQPSLLRHHAAICKLLAKIDAPERLEQNSGRAKCCCLRHPRSRSQLWSSKVAPTGKGGRHAIASHQSLQPHLIYNDLSAQSSELIIQIAISSTARLAILACIG